MKQPRPDAWLRFTHVPLSWEAEVRRRTRDVWANQLKLIPQGMFGSASFERVRRRDISKVVLQRRSLASATLSSNRRGVATAFERGPENLSSRGRGSNL